MTTTRLRRARLVAGAGAATLALVLPLSGVASATSGRDHAGQDTSARPPGGPGPHDPARGMRVAPWTRAGNWAGKDGAGRGADRHDTQGKDHEAEGKDPTSATTVPTTDPQRDGAKLDALKRRCTNAIDRRLVHLRALGARVARAGNLTDAHRAALAAIAANSATGLSALRATIQADTDLAALQGHCREIVTGYLVYRLVTPQVRLVIAADNAVAAAGWLDKAAARLADAIAAAKAAGHDTAAAEAKLAEMQREVEAGRAAVSGVADSVLALRPSDAGSIAGVLGAARTALASAKTHLNGAKRAGVQALAALRGGEHSG